jgi:hypothetical protein
MVRCDCCPRNKEKLKIGGIMVCAKSEPLSLKTRAKRAGGFTQEVECLPSKCKALSSNPSTAKRKRVSN